jgi:hypothetical protein
MAPVNDRATLKPGMVLCTRSKGVGGWWIRFGAAIRNRPNLQNHVAVVHHTDEQGTIWCLEGRPGGVGWKDAKGYLNDRWTISNADQPLTAEQGAAIAAAMEAIVGSAYDWSAIASDALSDLGMRLPGFDTKWKDGEVNGQYVCSSAAAYAYGKAHVPHPPGDKGTQPAHWTEWIMTRAWAK